MKYTVTLTRGTEVEVITREDTDTSLAASWLMGYMRAALLGGWTITSIVSE